MRSLAKVFASLAGVMALVLAPLVVPAAQAAVPPTQITGISYSASVVESGQVFTLDFAGLAPSDTTTWDGAHWYEYKLEGSDVPLDTACFNNPALINPTGAVEINPYATAEVITFVLYPSGTSCIDAVTPPASAAQFSTTVTVLPVLSAPAITMAEGTALAGESQTFALTTNIVNPPWQNGGDVALVADWLCDNGVGVATPYAPSTSLPAGVTFETVHRLESGTAPSYRFVGTPEAGTAGTYSLCLHVTDGPDYTCTSLEVSLCALSDAPGAYALLTLTVEPALASTGAPNQSGGIWLGIGAAAVVILGITLIVILQVARRRKNKN